MIGMVPLADETELLKLLSLVCSKAAQRAERISQQQVEIDILKGENKRLKEQLEKRDG